MRVGVVDGNGTNIRIRVKEIRITDIVEESSDFILIPYPSIILITESAVPNFSSYVFVSWVVKCDTDFPKFFKMSIKGFINAERPVETMEKI